MEEEEKVTPKSWKGIPKLLEKTIACKKCIKKYELKKFCEGKYRVARKNEGCYFCDKPCPCEACEHGELINRLQELYDDNKLSDKDEDTILKTIEFLGGEINW